MRPLIPKLQFFAICKLYSASILGFVSVFSFLNTANAQSKADTTIVESTLSKFEIGIAGGLTVNKFSNGQPQTGINTGYVAGVLVTYNIYKQFSLQLEANFIQQGGQLLTFKDDTRFGLPEDFTTKNVKNSSVHLNSLNIPLLLRYSIPLKKDWKPAVYIGGSYAYNFNATARYQKTGDLLPGEDIISTVSDSENVTSRYNRDRINLLIGADLRLPLFSKVKLLLEFRYLAGATPARESYSYMEKVGFGSDIRSNSFVSKLGLLIPVQ
ncbi:Outer membrane protein beta-barrel domain-containing protein [Pedobacter terrae]|uniref:Outer membrane protein beta-barrel domain-containing protein n=1 Tax=Pedobacter terrae TaxID=405671 RepID=A0A1G7NVA9_9SPHI|nr:porin family protein [Pedobacter terrae]SDF77952.1 Outer membrane protein beta-barrel domain-containing protein [Pedobacter terrae]